MQELSNNDYPMNDYNEIDVKELFKFLLQEKWIAMSITFLIFILSLIYSLTLPNIFESKAILIPIESQDQISSNLSNYSRLTAFAGVDFPINDNQKSVQAIQKMKSLSFFQQHIFPNIFLPDLMALKSWDPEKNTLNYSKDIYDRESNTWTRKYAYPQKLIPSEQESFQKFITKHLTLSEDKQTGFINISIKHQSPVIAKEWTELVINQINSYYRKKDKLESTRSIDFLNNTIASNNISEIKQSITQLLQEQIKKLALIESNMNYVFDYIDPPAVMETKSEPKRSIIVLLGALFGGFLSIIYLFIKYYFKKLV